MCPAKSSLETQCVRMQGDALHSMELALAMEKLNLKKLWDLHEIADKHNDYILADFVDEMIRAC